MIPTPHDPVAVVWIVGLIIAYLCVAIGARLLSSPFDDDAAHALGHVTMG